MTPVVVSKGSVLAMQKVILASAEKKEVKRRRNVPQRYSILVRCLHSKLG